MENNQGFGESGLVRLRPLRAEGDWLLLRVSELRFWSWLVFAEMKEGLG